MRPEGCEPDLLRALASMPFLNRLEMVAVTGWSKGAVYEAIERLESGGLCASVLHATELLPQARRFHLTAAGLHKLACDEGMAPDELVRHWPVSAQWRRSLMERLDALTSIYGVASAVSDVAFPVRFHWYRSIPLDAAMTLPGGRTVGVVRQGPTADRSGFAKRLWRLRDWPMPGTVLVLAADEVRLRHARRALSTTDAPALLALERDAVLAGAGERVWSPPRVGASVALRYALERAAPGGGLLLEPEPGRADPPADLPDRGAASDMTDRMLPVVLRPAEKRALDLISDWPWISLGELAGLLDVTPQRASNIVIPLEGFGLAARPREAGGRLALTDRGLSLLARRDRTSESDLAGAFNRRPGSPNVHLHPSTVGEKENALVHRLDPQLAQKAPGQRRVGVPGVHRRLYLPLLLAVHAGNPQRPLECPHRESFSFSVSTTPFYPIWNVSYRGCGP